MEDLCVTADGMVEAANLKGYLTKLSEAFFEVYNHQRRPDFWGMREFYSTVKVINAELKRQAAEGLGAALDAQLLMRTVQRNFGGQPPEELEACVEEFFERTGMNVESAQRFTTAQLIQQNLEEPDARHLMLLTKNSAALRLLFESGLLDHTKAEVMFGSTFPGDQSDVFVATNLQKIKSFMQQPISLVMVHCDSLYESLYDLLNQHYMEYGGQRYVRIAHGSKAKQCPMHRRFRVIVVTEIHDAYFRLAPPLLNRFEKQIFLRKDLMTQEAEVLLTRVSDFWRQLCECMGQGRGEAGEGEADLDALAEAPAREAAVAPRLRPVAGYHRELLRSLVFTLRRRAAGREARASVEEQLGKAKRLLTWVLTPEAVCLAVARLGPRTRDGLGFDLVSEFFERQRHSDLPSFAELLVGDRGADLGAQVMVITYSPMRKVGQELARVVGGAPTEISLHELSSSLDIEKCVQGFYGSASAASAGGLHRRFLLIHADPLAASMRMIEHCRFVCKKARSRLAARGDGDASVFVLLIVHLQRGADAQFSFDFDSQWRFVFLDSVEPSVDMNGIRSLGEMLNMPLIDLVAKLEFSKLLRDCFRSSLSRLIYPHSRKSDDLHHQIAMILAFLEDARFTTMVREWVLRVLSTTPKDATRPDLGTFGEDTNWFAAIATAAHELAMAGTFRAALHGRVVSLVGSLLTVLLAHLDRNSGLALLSEAGKAELWLRLSAASLSSPLSARLHGEGAAALREAAMAQHEVSADAQTGAKPFQGRFPCSWFVSRSLDGVRHNVEALPQGDQMGALVAQYGMSKLREVGLDPALPPVLLEDYLGDFAAMHLDWTPRIDRDTQHRILQKTLQRTKGGPLESILEIHLLFWRRETHVAYCVSLLNAVPGAVPEAELLIEAAGAAAAAGGDARHDELEVDLLLLVHRRLMAELLEATEQSPGCFYREWLSRKIMVSGLTRDFLASDAAVGATEKLTRLKTSAEARVETLALLLEHVASPLQLELGIVRDFASRLPAERVRSTATLRAILQMAEGIAGRTGALEACGAFIESWVLDVCLRDAEAIDDLDETSLRLVCSLAAGLPVVAEEHTTAGLATGSPAGSGRGSEREDCGIATLGGAATVPRSSCLSLALLRKLLLVSRGRARERAAKRIEALLKEAAEREGHNDSAFAARYAVLCEEAAAAELQRLEGPEQWPELRLREVFSERVSPASTLGDVGKIRWMLMQYAEILCQEPIDPRAHEKAVAKVASVLQTDDEALLPVCRSMRLYLLKCVERAKGVSFSRGLLARPPLSEAAWVRRWRELHDMDFEKFIGAALVPKWNPFSDGTKEYKEAEHAVFEMMASTTTVKLEQYARACRAASPPEQRRKISGLLLALTQEPGLTAALEERGRRPAWRAPLNQWLRETQELPVTGKERMLLRIFAGDETALDVEEEHAEALAPFLIGARPAERPVSLEELLRWRLLGHLAAVLLASPPGSLLAALRVLMLEAPSPTDGAPCFLPSMDEDIRNRVLKALLERGETIWKFKSHWWKCRCGYTFFIGECGRPMEVTSCPQCNVEIGGRDHRGTSATSEDTEADRSPEGYMLPSADKDERHISFRDIPSTSARMMRLLLHGAMFCGVAADARRPMPRVFQHLVNRSSMCTLHQELEAEYIGEHWRNDWLQMVTALSSNAEDLAAHIHAHLGEVSRDGQDSGEGKIGGRLAFKRRWSCLDAHSMRWSVRLLSTLFSTPPPSRSPKGQPQCAAGRGS